MHRQSLWRFRLVIKRRPKVYKKRIDQKELTELILVEFYGNLSWKLVLGS